MSRKVSISLLAILVSFLLTQNGFSSVEKDPLMVDHSDTYQAPRLDSVLKYPSMVMPILEEHFFAFESYTVNQLTPGYKEFTFGNIQEGDKILGRKFFRLGVGPPIETGSKMDIYIEGKVFYVVRGPFGTAYLRDGRFDIDIHGRLVTFTDHFLVMGENGPIFIGDRDIYVSPRGEIYKDDQLIDVLKVVQFTDLRQIDSFNSHTFFSIVPDDQLSVAPNPTYFFRQGYYEGSAVVKGLIGEVPRFKHVYLSSAYVVQRALRMYHAGISIGNPQ